MTWGEQSLVVVVNRLAVGGCESLMTRNRLRIAKYFESFRDSQTSKALSAVAPSPLLCDSLDRARGLILDGSQPRALLLFLSVQLLLLRSVLLIEMKVSSLLTHLNASGFYHKMTILQGCTGRHFGVRILS